jgi:hypothetical protein
MKKLWKRLLSVSLVSAILVSGCSTAPVTQNFADTQQINASSADVVSKSDIYREKLVNVNIEKASLYGDTVEVSSSFSQFTARTSQLAKGSSDTLVVNDLSPQLVTLMDDQATTKTPLALSVIANPQRSQTVLISPQTTAEALVFMDPSIATDDLGLAEKIMNIVKAQPETSALAKVIESRVQKDPNYLYKEDAQQDAAMSKAVNAVVNKLADEYDRSSKAEEPANRVAGIEINVSDQTDMTAYFEIKNYKKRMVDLYFDGNNRPIYKESIRSAYDLIDLDNLSLGYKPFIYKGGYDIQRPMDQVEVIGMGLKDIKQFKEKWADMDQPTKMKYGMPMAQGLMSDFVSPVISIITGFNVNKVYHVGLMKLITGLPILDIIALFKDKQYGKAFKLILSGTIKSLLEKNGALLRELLLAAGLSLSEAFLKRLNAIVGIFNLIRYAIEAGRALYAYVTTNIMDSFKVDNSTGKLQFLKNTAPSGLALSKR